jgi:hypothetical protein
MKQKPAKFNQTLKAFRGRYELAQYRAAVRFAANFESMARKTYKETLRKQAEPWEEFILRTKNIIYEPIEFDAPIPEKE